jgi:hypothetical protein
MYLWQLQPLLNQTLKQSSQTIAQIVVAVDAKFKYLS